MMKHVTCVVLNEIPADRGLVNEIANKTQEISFPSNEFLPLSVYEECQIIFAIDSTSPATYSSKHVNIKGKPCLCILYEISLIYLMICLYICESVVK
jgi:hypothetical protein